MNYFTPQEVTAAQWLYRTAPAGAQVIAVNSNFPWAFVHYNRYSYTFLDGSGYSSDTLRNPVQEISFLMSPPYPKRLLPGAHPEPGRAGSDQRAVVAGPVPAGLQRPAAIQRLQTVYLAKGVTILRLTPGPGARPRPPSARTRRPARTGTRWRATAGRCCTGTRPARRGTGP